MTINQTLTTAAALARLRANSDARVLADIDRVLEKALKDSAGRSRWSDAARALQQFRQARFGPVPEVAREAAGPSNLVTEAVVRAVGRPVYFVRDNGIDVASASGEATAWNGIIQESASVIARALVGVGRIEVENFSGTLQYVGTGWLADEGVIVTNKHVAEHFAERDGAGFRFRIGRDRSSPMRVRIDYREEHESAAIEEMTVERIIWMPPTNRPDIAFLGLAAGSASPARRAIPLARTRPQAKTMIAVIGYPARDFDFWDKELLSRLFGDVYDKKRFAPGNVIDVSDADIDHDCTTLGGNSGSVVLDLGTGEAVGLHYAGIPLVENRAVPAALVAEALKRARSQTHEVITVPTPNEPSNPAITIAPGESRVLKFTVPIEISVSIGGGIQATSVASAVDIIPRPTLQQTEAAVQKARELIGRRDDVVTIKAGYRFEDGYITPQQAVVIAVENKQTLGTLRDRGIQPLPKAIDGVPVDVTNATLADVLAREGITEAFVPRGHNYVTRTDPKFRLKRVKERMKATLHSGPDSGWANLAPFLKRTRRRLTIGMFEYTAPHIVNAGLDAIKGASEQMLMVVQKGEDIGRGTKANDIPDEETVRRFAAKKGKKFKSTWASIRFKDGINPVNPDGIFDSSYHIKVAVRDGKEFWLSSGSWQSSNQPSHDPIADGDLRPAMINDYNREWHVIIEHDGLAALYEAHLRQDYEDALASPMPEAALALPETFVWVPAEYLEASPEAARIPPQYFPPLHLDRIIDVQPVLSPDNYLETVLELIKSANRSIYFQNQSLKIRKSRPDGYDKLLRALQEKHAAGIDVRIIFRPFESIRDDLTEIQRFGFDIAKVKLDEKCHTKGIIVDSKAVLVGSHNWTNAGTSYNRDASLIFYDEDIAKFYEKIFLYDWSRARRARINESVPAPQIARPDEAVPPPGMVKVSLSELHLE
jgi:hypothetical protein